MRILLKASTEILTIVVDDLETLHRERPDLRGLIADIHCELLEDLQDRGYQDFLVHDWDTGTFSVCKISDISDERILEIFKTVVENFDILDHL